MSSQNVPLKSLKIHTPTCLEGQDGLLIAPLLQQCLAPVEVGLDGGGLQLERHLTVLRGLCPLAELEVAECPVGEAHGRSRARRLRGGVATECRDEE